MSDVKLLAIIGPSGAGKTTLMSKTDLPQMPSVTTRPKRDTDREGKDYVFVDNVTFTDMLHNNELIEYVENYGNYYGLSKPIVDSVLGGDELHFVIVTYPGYAMLKDYMPPGTIKSIFIYTDLQTCITRLKDRGESEDSLMKRIQDYMKEVETSEKCDYLVWNPQGDTTAAVNTLNAILKDIK